MNMRVFLGNQYEIVKTKKQIKVKTILGLIFLFVIQFLLSYLGNSFNSIFYFLEIIPIFILLYLLFLKIKERIIDALLILLILFFLCLFFSDVLSLI